MKKIIFIAMMAMMTLSVSAQTTEFMGIPVDGARSEFEERLQAKGFVIQSNGAFEGEFAGEDVSVVLYSTKSGLVYRVSILWGIETSWSMYKVEMNGLKELFTQKYGKATEVKGFISPYYEGDGYELTALRRNKCIWMLRWGAVEISLLYRFGIVITYTNNANKEIADAEKKSDALNDI